MKCSILSLAKQCLLKEQRLHLTFLCMKHCSQTTCFAYPSLFLLSEAACQHPGCCKLPAVSTSAAGSSAAPLLTLLKDISCAHSKSWGPVQPLSGEPVIPWPKACLKSVQKPFQTHPKTVCLENHHSPAARAGMHVNKLAMCYPFKWGYFMVPLMSGAVKFASG